MQMTEPLFAYQNTGADFVANVGKALLADDPGTGKTAQLSAGCDRVNAKRITVICPASVTQNWRRELRRFRHLGDEGVTIATYNHATTHVSELKATKPDVLILDESHYAKDPTAQRTRAIYGSDIDGNRVHDGGLIADVPCVWPASGSPAPNNPLELHSMIHALWPQTIMRESVLEHPSGVGFVTKDMPLSYNRFMMRYCELKPGYRGFKIIGGKNLPELKALMAPYMLRRKIDDVQKDLPKLRYDTFALNMRRAPMADTAVEMAINMALESEDPCAALEDLAGQCATYRRMLGEAKIEAVAERVTDELEDGLDKIVLYGIHHNVLEGLRVHLVDYYPIVIDGSVKPAKRQELVDHFATNDKCRVLIGQLDAIGTGTDGMQHACNNLIYVESSWSPYKDDQGAKRLRRYGQKRPVLARYAYIPNSLDERIANVQRQKTATVQQLFD